MRVIVVLHLFFYIMMAINRYIYNTCNMYNDGRILMLVMSQMYLNEFNFWTDGNGDVFELLIIVPITT